MAIETKKLSVVMMGASGAVGSQALSHLISMPEVKQLTLLGRSPISGLSEKKITQEAIDIFDPSSYEKQVLNHEVAICTLGVGQPSKMSKEDFIKIDKTAVIDFATSCKNARVKHFELLSSVGANATSSSFYLRAKGELIDELQALEFDRLSIFEPSMILTPTNRYGAAQGITLFIWPLLKPLLIGSLRKFRGIKVEQLGQAIAANILLQKTGTEHLQWGDFMGF